MRILPVRDRLACGVRRKRRHRSRLGRCHRDVERDGVAHDRQRSIVQQHVATQLLLDQEGSTFSGSCEGGVVTCSAPDRTVPSPLGTGLVLNGETNGRNVSFDLITPELHHVGVVTGTSMPGTAVWRIEYGRLGTITLNGSWAARKQ